MDEFTTQSVGPSEPKWGIAPHSLRKLLRLFEQTPVLEAVDLFGSRARGDYKSASDVDLVVDAPRNSVSVLTGSVCAASRKPKPLT